MLISITYSEITLKGANRRMFESLLIRNALSQLSGMGKSSYSNQGGRILLSCESDDTESAKKALSRVFGIDSIAFPTSVKPDIDVIQRAVSAHSSELCGKKIRVQARRSDKRFPLDSQKINQIIGKALVNSGCSVDLENPDHTVFIDILSGQALIYLERIKGPGGLPVGSSGKVLSLLSGGIDSPVSSWFMMKRGCVVDFLHLHQSPRNADVLGTKIAKILNALRSYSPQKLKLYAAPYHEFYKAGMSFDPRSELVLFRRFLYHLGNRLAEKHGYKGVVSGDSIGQVASQTIDNIFASDEASKIPVFRPLVGFNKQEIVDLAKRIGTYETSILPYKDCCSLVAHKNPSTKVQLEKALALEKNIDIGSILEKTIEGCEIFEF